MEDSIYTPPDKDSVFLVSGGGKGITALCAQAIAEAFQSTFILLGRSENLVEDPAWAQNISDEAELKTACLTHLKSLDQNPSPKDLDREVKRVISSRAIRNTVEAIKEAGGKAEYIQVDITDKKDLEKKLGEQTRKINGILHGAGVLADKRIEDKTIRDLDLVYGVKVGGLQNLLDLVPLDHLKHLVLFSSVAGFYGNAGQTDYSLSNEVLNKISHYVSHHHTACQVVAIGWGPWDGGMVTPQLKRIFKRRGIPMISPAQGTGALIQLLKESKPKPQVIIGDQLPYPATPVTEELKTYSIARKMVFHENRFLQDHVIGGNAVLPTVCAVHWLIQACESIYPSFKFYSIEDYKVFKGIVFDSEYEEDYVLELNELEKDTSAVIFSGLVKSTHNGSKERFHYQAKIELRSEIPDPPSIQNYDLSLIDEIAGSELYDEKILFHGPSFQGVGQVLNISDKGLTTECKYPSLTFKDMGQFPVRIFNPYLADIHLQSLLIWAHHQVGVVGLPLRIAKAIHYRHVPEGTTTYATMTVREFSPRKLVADVISHDQDGRIFTEVIGAEITLTENLLPLFKQNQLEGEPA